MHDADIKRALNHTAAGGRDERSTLLSPLSAKVIGKPQDIADLR